jgi:hypothetical protein
MQFCPICYSALEPRPVAPCYDCGHVESELAELVQRVHVYHEYRAFGHTLILCDFCDADFGSYHSSYFGPSGGVGTVGQVLDLVKTVDPTPYPIVDGFCESCGHRLAFLQFLAAVRKDHETGQGG